MRRRSVNLVVMMLVALLVAAPQAFAQGGGASTTGSINGKVLDASGAVLPGVTVTAASRPGQGGARRRVCLVAARGRGERTKNHTASLRVSRV